MRAEGLGGLVRERVGGLSYPRDILYRRLSDVQLMTTN